ncbi:hypothetical protein GCE86_24660 [Micromonospora terminaliae]|uniref:Uncharacterized protein n=1 Tax=Micromonospora terminaliae TaxID=1914461 RepID=A0AAJ2ZHP8_9ACTN|nr:hypothetical protein [Micromonospora terminaliae]NES29895.1 hypothetical protein [Micromonospora terminaliae]QGL49930.1 hypothetical protein GCE86_24660 [Micromonospora terminaliae]
MGRNLWITNEQWSRLVAELDDLGVHDVSHGNVYADWVSIAVVGGTRELVCFLTVLAAILCDDDATIEDRTESIRTLAEQIKAEPVPGRGTVYYLWKWTVGSEES